MLTTPYRELEQSVPSGVPVTDGRGSSSNTSHLRVRRPTKLATLDTLSFPQEDTRFVEPRTSYAAGLTSCLPVAARRTLVWQYNLHITGTRKTSI